MVEKRLIKYLKRNFWTRKSRGEHQFLFFNLVRIIGIVLTAIVVEINIKNNRH